MLTISTDHEILVDQDLIVEVLSEVDFNECVIGPAFTHCLFKAWYVSKEECMRNVLIATFLLKDFEAIKIKKENRIWEMYGYDAKGEKHMLLIKGY